MAGFRGGLLAALAVLVLAPIGIEAAEPKWESLIARYQPRDWAVSGSWKLAGEALQVDAAEGARTALPVDPPAEYDVRARFTRRTGQHSVGVIVVQNGHQVVFEVDAWGRHLGGFQNVAGKSIQENATRKENVALTNGKEHTIVVEVRKNQLRGLLDGREIASLKTDGGDLTIHEVWAMPNHKNRLGLVAWDSATTFQSVELLRHGADTAKPAVATASPAAEPRPQPMPTRPPMPATTPGREKAGAKRALIVIANHHFFYREYADPRQELERAGIRVTVAAGRKGPCRPHDGSGQGADGGMVQADVALSDVKAADYDVLLFSGGWGASAYQFAFNGRYNEPAYNGERAVKAEANRVINEFLAQDKYVCALCNGVSILAWARVNGKSPLAGKRVCAPTREAPPGIYNGRPGQPSCRWHPEVNGARLSPAGAIGRPGTPVDDVLVDGRIVTGEDDPSARAMGQKIVELLTEPAATR